MKNIQYVGIYIEVYKPGGADPHASQRIGVLLPATSKLFAVTILTLVGFTTEITK